MTDEIEFGEYRYLNGIGLVTISDDIPCKILAFDKKKFRVGTYVPERTASIVKVPRHSHVALGHYECGGCGATIDAGDRYCRRCGARLEGTSE